MLSKIISSFEKAKRIPFKKRLAKICAEQIGYGIHRDVYISAYDRRFVIKVERDMSEGYFANVTEWRNWNNASHWGDFLKWLAPCELITEDGVILAQRRVYHYKNRKYPDKIPSLFTDLKRTNFGWIGNRFVCCDYSFLLSDRFYLKKAKWWNLEDRI